MLRFGRKIPLPSTAQIKHELRLMTAADAFVDEARLALKGIALSAKESAGLARQLGSKHGISAESSRALVDLIAKPDLGRPAPRLA